MDSIAKQLAETQKSGVYQLIRQPEEIEQAAKQVGLAVFRMDFSHIDGKKDLLDQAAKALQFPSWFGSNWDALNDSLTDLEWLGVKAGYVLVFENIEHFARSYAQEFHDATQVLRAASEYWKNENRPFWAFFSVSSAWDSGLPRWPAIQLV
jgi:RNAse (barnase) inhibitor barstar